MTFKASIGVPNAKVCYDDVWTTEDITPSLLNQCTPATSGNHSRGNFLHTAFLGIPSSIGNSFCPLVQTIISLMHPAEDTLYNHSQCLEKTRTVVGERKRS